MSTEVRAVYRNMAVSPQKARLVADQIRGLAVQKAINVLALSPKKTAGLVAKALNSAVANAKENNGLDVDTLYVASIFVDGGMKLKRFKPKGMGRTRRRTRLYSHLTVTVAERS